MSAAAVETVAMDKVNNNNMMQALHELCQVLAYRITQDLSLNGNYCEHGFSAFTNVSYFILLLNPCKSQKDTFRSHAHHAIKVATPIKINKHSVTIFLKFWECECGTHLILLP